MTMRQIYNEDSGRYTFTSNLQELQVLSSSLDKIAVLKLNWKVVNGCLKNLRSCWVSY